jgi:hypothetical protein
MNASKRTLRVPLRNRNDARYAMTTDDNFRQPNAPSSLLANYLDMTAPRRRASKVRPRRRDGGEQTVRPPIDNRGLSLEEGNDFA